MQGLADVVSATSYEMNASWPFYSQPRFEQFAHNHLFQSQTELISIVPMVSKENVPKWIEYTNKTHKEWVREGHSLKSNRQGNHNMDVLHEKGYTPYIKVRGKERATFYPSPEQDVYWPMWTFSPPPFSYGAINWDYSSIPDYEDIIKAALTLKNQTLYTRIRQYAIVMDVAITPEEHRKMHSPRLAGIREELPHSILTYPILRIPDDQDSDIVALLVGGVAWDRKLMNLLPDEAQGVLVVVENDCGQQYTFKLNGPDAFYLGPSDKHEERYSRKRKSFPVTVYSHPDARETKGHCRYSMVR